MSRYALGTPMKGDDRHQPGSESFFLLDLVGGDYRDTVGSQVSYAYGNVHGWREPVHRKKGFVPNVHIKWWRNARAVIIKSTSFYGTGNPFQLRGSKLVGQILRKALKRSDPDAPIHYDYDFRFGEAEEIVIQSIWKGWYGSPQGSSKIWFMEQIWPSPYGVINHRGI